MTNITAFPKVLEAFNFLKNEFIYPKEYCFVDGGMHLCLLTG